MCVCLFWSWYTSFGSFKGRPKGAIDRSPLAPSRFRARGFAFSPEELLEQFHEMLAACDVADDHLSASKNTKDENALMAAFFFGGHVL